MKTIDIENWKRKKTYLWFKNFSNPCYGITSKLKITKVVEFSKRTKTSFYANILYLVVRGLNSIEEMRMRMVKDNPVIFDKITPAYTVMTDDGFFDNVRHDYCEDYKTFYKLTRENIDKAKNGVTDSLSYNEDRYDEFYITCVPWMNFLGVTHPIPDETQSQNVPRICWGKYYDEGNEIMIDFNITVSHIFVDGYTLSKCFSTLQELFDNCEKYLI